MKILSQINSKIREILGNGVLTGMEEGFLEISSDKIYKVGIGIDIGQRIINAKVQYALLKAILAANNMTLSAQTVEHSTGHTLKITYDRFIIFTKRVDYRSSDWREEAKYHKQLMANNPSKQLGLFSMEDTETPVFVQLRFGKKNHEYFASLRIVDSITGGVFEEEELELQSVILAPEEKVRTPKKLSIRSEMVSGL